MATVFWNSPAKFSHALSAAGWEKSIAATA
jgi:hypothetical protein